MRLAAWSIELTNASLVLHGFDRIYLKQNIIMEFTSELTIDRLRVPTGFFGQPIIKESLDYTIGQFGIYWYYHPGALSLSSCRDLTWKGTRIV